MRPLDPLDDSNSLSDLARSMHHMQPFPAQSASDEAASTHGPLVQLMHNISKVTGSAGSAVVAAGEDVNTSDGEVVNHAATVSLGRPQGLEEMAGSVPDPDAGAAMQHAHGESLSEHPLQSLVTDGDPINGQENDEGGVLSVAGSSAQDFFKGRGQC